MFIQKLIVENWKCFNKKKVFEFQNHELITMKNGSGKTSIFQAIIFAIWGKTPVGFNFNSIRNDDSKPCSIQIYFTLQGNQYFIDRTFGGKNKSELYIDDVLIAESVRTIEDYMNKILNYKIVSQLWTASLIDSDMLRSDFFTKSLLEDALSEPLFLISHYKSLIYQNQRIINRFDEKIIDIKAISNEMEEIQSQLQAQVSGDINQANIALRAQGWIDSNAELINFFNKNGFSKALVVKFNSLHKKRKNLETQLSVEEQKIESRFSNFSVSELQKIINFSKQNGTCLICGEKITEEHINTIERELQFSGRSQSKINELKESLSFLNQYDIETIKLFETYLDCLNKIRSCPNFKEIINLYNEENDKLWNRYRYLQQQYGIALKQQAQLEEINKIKEETEQARTKLQVLNDFIEKSSSLLTDKFLHQASSYLRHINNRYQNIVIYDEAFHITVEQEDLSIHLLPVARLSNGEKTMVSLSLLLSIHNILVPEIPLLFDETFAALDRENLYEIQNFLRKQDGQIFIITHDKFWQEF